jgi:sigma-B regulation protein RsbU (phosphoserine phosphatase)
MAVQKQRLVGIYLPLLLFLWVLASDLNLFSAGILPYEQRQFRELLLGIALVVLLWGGTRLNWFKSRSLTQRLSFMGMTVLLLWGTIQLLSIREFSDLTFPLRSNIHLVYSFNHVIWTALFLLLVIFSVWILIALKELIFIQQGKKTERNYRLLIIFIFLQIVYTLAQGREGGLVRTAWGGWTGDAILDNIFFPFIVLFAFINGFRCKWIHYLNKGQKIGFFFFFTLITAVLAIHLIFRSAGMVQNYSHVIGSFVHYLFLVCGIYSGMALLGILFLLPSAGLLDRKIREIKSLQTLSATIGSVFDMKELISKTTELSVKVVDADFSWLELKEDSEYRLGGTHGITHETVGMIPGNVRTTIRNEVEKGDAAVLINDLIKNKNTREIKRWRRKVGSLLAAQIRFKDKELGILYVLKRETFGFVEESRALFQAFADQVAVALENVNLVQVTIDQEVYREELRMAHEAQMRLLPQVMPKVEGVELSAFCMTANEIGGDFYDFIRVDEDRLDIVIGDVSGKGASAAFYMAELKGVIQSLSSHFSSPKKMLIEINTFLRNHFESNTFATMVYGILLPSKKEIRLIRAGHTPIGLIRKGTVSWLETEGLGLGLAPSDFWGRSSKEKVLHLRKGDSVFFYTDGLVEARNLQGEEYGEEGLTETLIGLHQEGAEELLKDICMRLDEFTRGVPRHDDVTLVALRILK